MLCYQSTRRVSINQRSPSYHPHHEDFCTTGRFQGRNLLRCVACGMGSQIPIFKNAVLVLVSMHSISDVRSVVILHRHSSHILLLNAIFFPLALYLRVPVRARSDGTELRHCRRIFIPVFSRYANPLQDGAIRVRHEPHVTVRVCEVEQAKARITSLVWRWPDNAMDCSLVEAPGEHLHRVSRVDDLQRI